MASAVFAAAQIAAGNLYLITGIIGQSVADTTGANNASYKIQSGFFTAAPPVPTAASVTIGGRVLTADGRGIRNVIIVLTDDERKLANGDDDRLRVIRSSLGCDLRSCSENQDLTNLSRIRRVIAM